jgi:signal transduction histidine kinase
MRRVVSEDPGSAAGPFRRAGGLVRKASGWNALWERDRTALTPQDLHQEPGVANSMATILVALRWIAVLVGLPYAAQSATSGELRIVVTVAVAIFITTLRTMFPLKMGEPKARPMGVALFDVALLSVAIGIWEGFANPLVGALFIAVAVSSFGWGLPLGMAAAALAAIITTLVYFFAGDTFELPSALTIFGLVGAVLLPATALERLLEFEGRRRHLADEHGKLAQANQLLGALNDLARVLPSSLDQSDVIATARSELTETFGSERLVVLAYEDGVYQTLVQDGFHLPPEVPENELVGVLAEAAVSPEPMLVDDLASFGNRDGSGLYIRLVVRNDDIGLVGIEHSEVRHFRDSDRELLVGMAEMLALTLANARSFNQLRSLAADEERTKIARDLHDRLGQYLTYIALELERINTEAPSEAIKELHEDVQGAIGEFRDTLLELRVAVSSDRPLSIVLPEVVERFARRSEVEVDLAIADRSERLPARVENEFLRIAQEALTNVQKHAGASRVELRWSVEDGCGTLTVGDDGRGFDPTQGIRGSAYGLVGMRERAASIGAMLNVASEPGQGTVVTVQSVRERGG